MAKVAPRPIPRSAAPVPGYSPGYTWMLLFCVLAMAGGCALLYVELTDDYEFKTEPQGIPPVPKLEPLPPRDSTPPKQPGGGVGLMPDPDRAALDPPGLTAR